MVRTGATFADAASAFLRHAEHDRQLKPSTLRGYRSIVDAYLLPAFGERRLEDLTPADIERWRAELKGVGPPNRDRDNERELSARPLSNNSKNRIVVLLHGIFAHACKSYGLSINPVSGVERHPVRLTGEIDVFSPEEVWALARAPRPRRTRRSSSRRRSPAPYRRADRTQLARRRFRRVRLRVRANYCGGASRHRSPARSARSRWLPKSPRRLTRLSRRDWFTDEDDLVFAANRRVLDGSALRRRYKAALETCRAASAALSRPSPHLRHAHDRQGRHTPRAGVDGPCRHPDDNALPALRASRRGRAARR